MAKKRKRGLSPRIESYKRKINRNGENLRCQQFATGALHIKQPFTDFHRKQRLLKMKSCLHAQNTLLRLRKYNLCEITKE